MEELFINISEKKLTVIVSATAHLIMQLVVNMTVVALPDISETFSFSADVVLWVNLICVMGFVASTLPLAKIISQHGVKICTKISLLCLFISIIMSVTSVNGYVFLLSRLIQGITCASLSISLYVMIADEFSDEELGSALGIVASAGYVGLLIGPPFMGFMISFINWKAAFLILIPILAILLILLQAIKSEWIGERKSLDKTGSIIYILIMASVTYGITRINHFGGFFIILGVILFIMLYKIENKVEHPIINFRILKDFRYVIGIYVAMVSYFVTTIALTLVTFHLHYILDIMEGLIGLILVISPVVMIGSSNLGGRLSNKYDSRVLSGVAMIFILISMIMFFIMVHLPLELIIVACAIKGIGAGLFSAPNNKYVLTLVEKKDLADATSILSTNKEFGKILSSGIYTLILSIFIGNQLLGPDYLNHSLIQSSSFMMFICILLTLSAVILLFYSKFKYGPYENKDVVSFFKRITPKWLKKRLGY